MYCSKAKQRGESNLRREYPGLRPIDGAAAVSPDYADIGGAQGPYCLCSHPPIAGIHVVHEPMPDGSVARQAYAIHIG
jgi:hypothetical protein